MSIALPLHLLAVVVQAAGMHFAHTRLRPEANAVLPLGAVTVAVAVPVRGV